RGRFSFELLVAEIAGGAGDRDRAAGDDQALHEAAASEIAGDLLEIRFAHQLFFGRQIESHYDSGFGVSGVGFGGSLGFLLRRDSASARDSLFNIFPTD